jgi:hypothetical protein
VHRAVRFALVLALELALEGAALGGKELHLLGRPLARHRVPSVVARVRAASRNERSRYRQHSRRTSPSASCRPMIRPTSLHKRRIGTCARRLHTSSAVRSSLSRRPSGTPMHMASVSSMKPSGSLTAAAAQKQRLEAQPPKQQRREGPRAFLFVGALSQSAAQTAA